MCCQKGCPGPRGHFWFPRGSSVHSFAKALPSWAVTLGLSPCVIPQHPQMSRLGLLAVAFSDGKVVLYSLPHPGALQHSKRTQVKGRKSRAAGQGCPGPHPTMLGWAACKPWGWGPSARAGGSLLCQGGWAGQAPLARCSRTVSRPAPPCLRAVSSGAASPATPPGLEPAAAPGLAFGRGRHRRGGEQSGARLLFDVRGCQNTAEPEASSVSGGHCSSLAGAWLPGQPCPELGTLGECSRQRCHDWSGVAGRGVAVVVCSQAFPRLPACCWERVLLWQSCLFQPGSSCLS